MKEKFFFLIVQPPILPPNKKTIMGPLADNLGGRGERSYRLLRLLLYLHYSDTTLSKEGIKGSKLEVTLEYTRLKAYEISSRTLEEEFLEKYEKPTEESPGRIDD